MIYAIPCRGVMDPENMLKTAGREQGTRHTTGPLNFAVDPLLLLLPNPCVLMKKKATTLRTLETKCGPHSEVPENAPRFLALCDCNRNALLVSEKSTRGSRKTNCAVVTVAQRIRCGRVGRHHPEQVLALKPS